MQGVTYDGKEYDSLAAACRDLGISYQKLRRLRRHYVRAHKDPAVAIRWCLKLENKSWKKPRTGKYRSDLDHCIARQVKFKEKIIHQIGGVDGEID